MAANPTIVTASLDDSEMKQSIANLVASVKRATHTMVNDFDNAINRMNAKMKELGVNGANAGAASNASNVKNETQAVEENTKARRRNAQAAKEQQQANKETKMTLDQTAQAMQQATAPKSARESYYAFFQGFKQQAQEISQYMRSFETALNTAIKSRTNELSAQLEGSKMKIRELNNELGRMHFAGGNPQATAQVQAQLDKELRTYNEIKNALANVNQEFALQKAYLASLYAEHHRISNIMMEETSARQQQQQTTQQQISAEQSITEEIRKQAQAIRESKEFQRNGWALTADGSGAVYAQNKLSIEEQLLAIYTAQEERKQRLIREEQEQLAAEQTNAQIGQQELETQKQITKEYEKRKKYITPEVSGNEKFYGMLATKLGVENSVFSKVPDSIKQWQQQLKYLEDAYKSLTKTERNSAFGAQITEKIQTAREMLYRLKSEMNRPVSMDSILAFKPKTLDDISHSIQRLRAYRGSIDLTKPGAAAEIEKVDIKIRQLTHDADKYMSKQNEMMEKNNALTRSWNYMKNRLAFYFTVGASTQFIKSLVDIRSQYELLERSIGILIDSAQNGSKIFAELNSMAIKSPFTTMELGAAAKQLVAYDVAAKDVVDTTKRLADMAAAVGVPLERLTYALGQIKSYTYLNARDARMFANTGIPLVRELADMYTKLEGRLVSTADVYDRIKHKLVSYEDVMQVINKMTDEGGKFFNFQEKAADTLKVKLANLTLAYNNMMNEIGKDRGGFLSSIIKGAKSLFEHWRDIYNIMLAVIINWGIIKAVQLIVLISMKTMTKYMAVVQVLGKGIANTLVAIRALLMKLLTPVGLLSAAIMALSVVLMKGIFDYQDLQRQNEAFNKSIIDGAEENIKSIDKFFKEYKDELNGIGAASSTDQQKMWEKIQEEIEKTIKNANDYISKLLQIEDIADRISGGKQILQHQQDIERMAENLAKSGKLNMGGGFMDDNLAKDLRDYENTMKDFVDTFGSIEKAIKEYPELFDENLGLVGVQLKEAKSEIKDFISSINSVDIKEVMGDFDAETQFANIRNFATIIRDSFLATEDGSKVANEGQALLNQKLDEWIAKQGLANNLFQERVVNGKKYSAEEIAQIEANRTAWEKFFANVNAKDRETLDYAIDTHQTGSDEVKEIWDKAAKTMEESEVHAYRQIQEHIANLRNTPAIILDVIYRETTIQSTDPQINNYRKRFIEPQNTGILTPEEYFRQQERNTRKFGRFIKKEGENNVEWEKRLGQEYQDNAKSIKSLNNQLKNSAHLSEIDRKAKEEELQTLKEQQQVLEEIRGDQNFDFAQFDKSGKKNKNKGGSKKDVLGDALSKEVQLITDIRKRYDEYKKTGVSTQEAVNKATDEFGDSLKSVKNILSKFGISGLLGADVANMSMRELVDKLKDMEKIASAKKNAKGVEALEKAIASLNVEITKLDYKKLSEGLNNELNKLKEDYELAVELDANPELGDMFATMFGVNTNELPRTFGDLVKKSQEAINREFQKAGGTEKFGIKEIDMETLLSKSEFDKWLEGLNKEADSELVKTIENFRKYLVDARKKEAGEAIKGWDALLQKYAEYQYRSIKITKDAAKERNDIIRKFGTEEQKKKGNQLLTAIINSHDPNQRAELVNQLKELVSQVAGSDETIIQIGVGIDTKEAEEQAELAFEQFTKNPIWTTAIGDLEGMTHEALKLLVEDLEKFKKANKNLTPKQIRQIEKNITRLHKQIRKDNPFLFIADAIEDAKERAAEFDEPMKQIEADIEKLNQISDKDKTEDQKAKLAELINKLKELKKAKQAVGQVSAEEIVKGLNEAIALAQQATSYFTDMAEAIGGEGMTEAAENIKKTMSVIEKAGQGAALGAQLGGGWGAVIGGVVGGLSGVISEFADQWSGNKAITKKIEESVREVNRLENAYKQLDYTASNAYGAIVSGAKAATTENKKLQLAELERQLALEESRSSKNKDKDRIIELKGEIIDLKNDISDASTEIINELLGISSAGDGITNLVDVMIDAFKNGENAMDAFKDKWDEMVDNMIMKLLITTYMQNAWDKLMQTLKDKEDEYLTKLAKRNAGDTYIDQWQSGLTDYDILRILHPEVSVWKLAEQMSEGVSSEYQREIDNYRKSINDALVGSTNALDAASIDFTKWAIDYMKTDGRDYMMQQAELLKDALGGWFTAGGDKSKELSALQQGIQGITEDTAGALEAYMNSVSQQVYLHSDLLTEIRDAVVGMNVDIQLGVVSQILLQLQSSYQVQMSIQTTLDGWSNASGQAVRVELIS